MFSSRNHKGLFTRFFSALLGLIILFNLGINASHYDCEDHKHNQEESCSFANEFDACHRYIFHHEKSSSCDGSHKHFGTKSDECFACKYYKQRSDFTCFEHYSLAPLSVYKIQFVSTSFEDNSQDQSAYYLRGPPITA